MGRISLQRLLAGGLVVILFVSLVLSATGVAVMVRRYLWLSGLQDLQMTASRVQTYLASVPSDVPPNDPKHRRRLQRLQRLGVRAGHRSPQGRGEIFLMQSGQLVIGPEESEADWGERFRHLPEGVSLLENDGARWQVYVRHLKGVRYDQVVVVRPWTGSTRVVRMLVMYQVLTMSLVLLLASLAVRILARKISGPLGELGRWSTRIGEGPSDGLKASSIREVSELQASFLQMAERVDAALEAQRRFVADASHELKTPLAAISGMLELLESRQEMTDSDRARALTVATTEAHRMGALISELLVLSRAQAKRSGRRQDTALATLIEGQLETLRNLYPDETFVDRLDPGLRWSVNPDAFSRIVRNLVENAAKYAKGKPIEVELSSNSEGMLFEVIDHGLGIAPDRLPKLFARFYRMDEGRSRKQGGFGLGLAIAKALIEELGGELRVKSTLGEGATFTVVLRKS